TMAAGRPRLKFTFGTSSCENEAGTTKLPRLSSAEKKKPVWLAVRKSIRCLPSSTQTKAARQPRVIHKLGGGTCFCTSGTRARASLRSDGCVPEPRPPLWCWRRAGNCVRWWRWCHPPVDKFPHRQHEQRRDDRRDQLPDSRQTIPREYRSAPPARSRDRSGRLCYGSKGRVVLY